MNRPFTQFDCLVIGLARCVLRPAECGMECQAHVRAYFSSETFSPKVMGSMMFSALSSLGSEEVVLEEGELWPFLCLADFLPKLEFFAVGETDGEAAAEPIDCSFAQKSICRLLKRTVTGHFGKVAAPCPTNRRCFELQRGVPGIGFDLAQLVHRRYKDVLMPMARAILTSDRLRFGIVRTDDGTRQTLGQVA